MFYSNKNIEEFDRLVEILGFKISNSISDADYAYIDLEELIFGNSKENFINHNLSARELSERFNRIFKHFANYENIHPDKKQFRFLSFDLIDIVENYHEKFFRWSYYNHRFAASQGQDTEAMQEWHKLDQKLSTDEISKFKARRENNTALYLHVINNHKFFDQIFIGSIDPKIKLETKFGLDIAEEQYLNKIILNHKAETVCQIVNHKMSNLNLNLIKHFLSIKKIKLKGHIISNSRKLNHNLLLQIRNLFLHLNILESSIEECDFAFLINDIDILNLIPIVDTNNPIFTVDLSSPASPNFGYLLLKDDGFDQIYSYSKLKTSEKAIETCIRSLCAGLVYFLSARRFVEQIASNYMDDYFKALCKALSKDLKDFQNTLDLLANKLIDT